MDININHRKEEVHGSFEDEVRAKIIENEYKKYDKQDRAEREEVEKERQKKIKVKKIKWLWLFYFIVGAATALCYLSEIISFFVVGIIVMIGITVALLKDDGDTNALSALLLSLISLVGIALFWQFHLWWWMVGIIIYLIIVLIVAMI